MFNHRVGINKTTLRDHIQKRMPRAGDSLRTTKQTLGDHQKSCPNDRNYIAGYGCPAIKYILVTAHPVTIASSTHLVSAALSVKIRANTYRKQSVIRPRKKSKQPHLHTRSTKLYELRLE